MEHCLAKTDKMQNLCQGKPANTDETRVKKKRVVEPGLKISKTREYFSAKFGRYLFMRFLNRMTSLLCQFINFFKGGRVPSKVNYFL